MPDDGEIIGLNAEETIKVGVYSLSFAQSQS